MSWPRTILLLVSVLALAAHAGVTADLVKLRASKSSAVVPGKWHASLSKCRTYAENNKVPLVAVWSNGDLCGHCTTFESACLSSTFKTWMKSSGMVFCFVHSRDSDGAAGGSVYNWCWKNGKLNQFPFVRFYWPKGKVDAVAVGDSVDGGYSGSTGGSKMVTYIKKKFPGFSAKTPAAVKPYTVCFEPAGGTGTMAKVTSKVGATFTLPANTFTRADCSFNGWAKTAGGALAYKNKASVKNLTTVSNGVVTLYARWLKTTYRTYYTGLSCTITMQSSLKGWTTSTKVPGLKWSSTKYRWTGKPTKAGTYTVTFKKGTSSTKRKIVIVKDSIAWADGALGRILPAATAIDLDLSPTTYTGAPKSVMVEGLPEGLSYANGRITGTTDLVGSFKLTVTVVSSAGQKLTRAYYLNIGVPDCCIGTFNGFVGFLDTNRIDQLALLNRGTFRLAAPSNAALSAKVVTAKGTYALTATGWRVIGNGTYSATLTTTTGKDVLTVVVDESSPPDKSIAEIGSFTPSYGTAYEVWAQRAPFARNPDGSYVDPLMESAMNHIVGKWYFKAYAVGSQWELLYATSKTATLTLTVAADGTTKLAGKIGSSAVSASSAVFVFSGDVETGYVRADFPVPVVVSKTKKTLDIWTNLWFDRSNSHFNSRGEGIGGASLETFK